MCSTLSMGNYNYNFFLMCDTARTCFFIFLLFSSCYLYFLSICRSFIHSSIHSRIILNVYTHCMQTFTFLQMHTAYNLQWHCTCKMNKTRQAAQCPNNIAHIQAQSVLVCVSFTAFYKMTRFLCMTPLFKSLFRFPVSVCKRHHGAVMKRV